jgi:uracil phosphoribosyltransferase
MPNVTVIDHPLVIAKLTRLRCKDTDSLDFRRLLGEISLLMAYEVARSFRSAKTKLKQQ